jgi:protein-L-isoaspartate(D-aspartate) O-methyltransferase
VARETELLEVTRNDRVLEIGAGFWLSNHRAGAGRRARSSHSNVLSELARGAQTLVRSLGIHNTTIRWFDGTIGWSEFGPYRGILVAAGSPEVPQPLIEQLTLGGRLVIPVGDEKSQRLLRITRTEKAHRQKIAARASS